MNFKIHR